VDYDDLPISDFDDLDDLADTDALLLVAGTNTYVDDIYDCVEEAVELHGFELEYGMEVYDCFDYSIDTYLYLLYDAEDEGEDRGTDSV
jgi:hypothetical protein